MSLFTRTWSVHHALALNPVWAIVAATGGRLVATTWARTKLGGRDGRR
jgi:hypothetical protein